MISFERNKKRCALIYVHCDGYPDGEHGIIARFNQFLIAVHSECEDCRFYSPEYLAAKFVVWFVRQKTNTLEFLGIGISQEIHGDIDYLYHINCDDEDDDPVLTYEKYRK